MTRRELLASTSVLLMSPLIGHIMSGRRFYGPLTVERWHALRRNGINLRVFCHGEDVSNRCSFADDTPGHERADLYLRDPNAKFYYDPATNNVAREQIFGVAVEIREIAQ
jgi:hypothetical protein